MITGLARAFIRDFPSDLGIVGAMRYARRWGTGRKLVGTALHMLVDFMLTGIYLTRLFTFAQTEVPAGVII